MGPKRRSTEGAGSSSSSLLHKVARTPGRKGVRFSSQSKHIVENVRAIFEKEKACKSTINRMAVMKRTAEVTGLSDRTIRDIHKEHVARDGQLLIPVKRYTTSRCERSLLAHGKLTGYTTTTKTDRLLPMYNVRTYILTPTKTREYKQRHQTIITHLTATSSK